MRTIIATAAAVLAAASPTAALDAAQSAAIDKLAASAPAGKSPAEALAGHYAILLWVEDYCHGRSDDGVRDYIMAKAGADQAQFEASWQATTTMLASTDRTAMCELALRQYGPQGALIPGAWSPKPQAE